jgi:SAM-dependent methyltransferase
MSAGRPDWEHRYERGGAEALRPPSQFLARHVTALPHGRALDLACGEGRNAILLARRGFTVEAIDFSFAGLARLSAIARREDLAIHCLQADLERYPLPRARYAVVLNIRYLQRSLFAPMRAAVAAGGVIVFETFLREQARLGHPKNPAFLLEPGELRRQFADFELLTYEEGRFECETGEAHLARMVARRTL